jgi:hypothetical protein
MDVSATPQEGYLLRLLLPNLDRTVWWGPDVTGQDVVAVTRGSVLTWATPEECLDSVVGRGWTMADPDTTVMDLRPVAEWSVKRGLPLEAGAALNAWNLADDVVRSIGLRRRVRDQVTSVCYDKLFFASVPWAANRDSSVPRWTKHQMRCLRRQLGVDLALITRAFAEGDTDGRHRQGGRAGAIRGSLS